MFSMKTSAERRLEILSFISERVSADGQPPTLAEIAAACGFASRSAVRKHVQALLASGQLQADPGKARSARPKSPRTVGAPTTNTLFELDVEDVRALDDTDFRELVSRAYRARLADHGFPTEFVIWGGDQRASDGGIDVRIDVPEPIRGALNLPARQIGIQVKATRMQPSDISLEMRPGGILRSSIRDLIRAKGAYIIASTDKVADSKYAQRVSTMKAAAATEPGAEHATFDFYDVRRLTDWVNQHPGVVAWARTRLGRAFHGWRPYGQWTPTRGDKQETFIDDPIPRVVEASDKNKQYSLLEGVRRIRDLIRRPGTSIRLIGLSGVGKTRFVQALFEETATPDAIAPELAVYADGSDSLVPSPQAIVDELVANKRHAILIIDNCSPQLHAKLTERCQGSRSISVITIEYDIRDDLPEATNVFQLERGSPDTITKIIENQFPKISQVDVNTITRFADGNARVAAALASTLEHRDTLAGLNDTALFERLFWQGRQTDQSLLRAAQACALVYSFDGEDTDTELPHLAALAGMSVIDIYRQIDELIRRGLAQKRGPWRAVLPHAIANTLAKQALSAIPRLVIEKELVSPNARAFVSFSRRIGYMHEDPIACAIVNSWHAPGGILHDVAQLEGSRIDVLRNVAPVNPDSALTAIERAAYSPDAEAFLTTKNPHRTQLVRLVRSIAWDPALFDRCVKLLSKFHQAETDERQEDPTNNVITSLFTLYLSGTNASEIQRAAWIRGALSSHDVCLRDLGVECLDSALEAYHFASHFDFDFGARPRSYGYVPHDGRVATWYVPFLEIAKSFGSETTALGDSIRNLFAKKFRSLWTCTGLFDELEQVIVQFTQHDWERGWLAIKQTLQFDGNVMPSEVLTRLKNMEALTRPRTLIQETKTIVLTGFSSGLDITDVDDLSAGGITSYERAELKAYELGQRVVGDASAFRELLPLVVQNREGRQWRFGAGLASRSDDPSGTWASLANAYLAIAPEFRNVQVLRGFLSDLHGRSRELFETILDHSMVDSNLTELVPTLMLCVDLDDTGAQRLLYCMDNTSIPARSYELMGYGGITKNLSDENIALLLQKLAKLPHGLNVALEVTALHTHDNTIEIGPKLKAVTMNLLATFQPARNVRDMDYLVGFVVNKFLQGSEGEPCARSLLSKIRIAMDEYSLHQYEIDDTLEALFASQPRAALDEFLDIDRDRIRFRLRNIQGDHGRDILHRVSNGVLIEWCQCGSPNRWISVAEIVQPFARVSEGDAIGWSEAALALLQSAPDPLLVASILIKRIPPTNWSGSRAEIIRKRLPLLDNLAQSIGPGAEQTIGIWRENLMTTLERERAFEREEDRNAHGRFE